MKRNVSARWIAVVASLAVTQMVGCAGVDMPHVQFPSLDLRRSKPAASEPAGQEVNDARSSRQARNAETLARLRRNRDFAEYQAARFCHERGDDKACAEGLKRLLARNPDHRDARLLMAEVLAGRNSAGAIEAVQYLLDRNPEDSEAHHALALLLDADGREAEALSHYERAASLKPDNEVYRVSYQTALLAAADSGEPGVDMPCPPTPSSTPPPAPQSTVAPSEPHEAVSPARSNVARRLAANSKEKPAPATEPSAMPAAPAPSTLAARPNPVRQQPASEELCVPNLTGSGIKPKVEHTDYTESADPSGNAAQSGRAEPVSYAKEAKDAGDSESGDYGQRGSARPAPPISAETLLARGKEAISQDNTTTALAYFRKAIATNPDDPKIPTSAAMTALRHNHPKAAVELLNEAVAAHPANASLRRILAVAYYRVGEYTSSQVAAEQALSLDKSNALSYFLVGSALARLGKTEASEVHLRQARRLDPRFGAAR